LNNPVLIVEVLVEKQAQQDAEDEANQTMKFTFSKEDLIEVSVIEIKIKQLLSQHTQLHASIQRFLMIYRTLTHILEHAIIKHYSI
jgi:hypothetical protein